MPAFLPSCRRVLAESPSGKLTYQNRAAASLLGRSAADVGSYQDYGHYNFIDAHGERIAAEDLPLARTVLNHSPSSTEELLYERGDGVRLHFAVTTAAITDSDGVARIAVAVIHDVSNLKRTELSAATEKERALVTLAAITDGVITADRRGAITSVNPVASRMTGVAEHEARGRTFSVVLRFDEAGGATVIIDALERCLKERRVIANLPHLTMVNNHGQHYSVESAVAPVTLADDTLLGALLIFDDVTESKRLMRRLGFEASHEALTGLVNRREFEIRLKRALERTRQSGADTAVLLYMDLDQYKIVNHTCGHSAGDDLLKELANS